MRRPRRSRTTLSPHLEGGRTRWPRAARHRRARSQAGYQRTPCHTTDLGPRAQPQDRRFRLRSPRRSSPRRSRSRASSATRAPPTRLAQRRLGRDLQRVPPGELPCGRSGTARYDEVHALHEATALLRRRRQQPHRYPRCEGINAMDAHGPVRTAPRARRYRTAARNQLCHLQFYLEAGLRATTRPTAARLPRPEHRCRQPYRGLRTCGVGRRVRRAGLDTSLTSRSPAPCPPLRRSTSRRSTTSRRTGTTATCRFRPTVARRGRTSPAT